MATTDQTTTVRCYSATVDELHEENRRQETLADTTQRILDEREELQAELKRLRAQLDDENERTPEAEAGSA
jgi:predicted  nucleic acid-binding Zn-ribbon protein